MKKFLICTAIAAAAMFTACDDDDSTSASDKTYSCEVKANLGALLGDLNICAESADQTKMTNACGKAGEMLKALGVDDAAKTGTSCPSGAKKTCNGKLDGVDYTVYSYTEDDVEKSCDEITAQVDQLSK